MVKISAKTGKNLSVLLDEIKKHLPNSEKLYPDDEITDQNLRAIASEIIREKIILNTKDEIPHSVAVLIEEYKQTEGNPQIKGKIKELQRRMAMSRMMQSVPEADVVLRNPTHFAVALKYDDGKDAAPIVVAKGQDEMALRIIKIAEEKLAPVKDKVRDGLSKAEEALGKL